MNREIRLIALDLDGTTLTSEKVIAERTKAAIRAAVDKGVEVVLSSGRSRNGVMPFIRELPGMHYMIASNGGSAIELASGRLIYGAFIKPQRAAAILDRLMTIGVLGDIYYDGGAVCDEENYRKIVLEKNSFPQWFIEYYISNRRPVKDLAGLVRSGKLKDIEKVTVSFEDMELRARAYELMGDETGLSIVSGSPFNMEISQQEATKGKALTALAKALGIDMEQVMACGDSNNDASMIEAAGIGVAMKNADEKVLAAADYVSASNDEYGVALAIERFVL